MLLIVKVSLLSELYGTWASVAIHAAREPLGDYGVNMDRADVKTGGSR